MGGQRRRIAQNAQANSDKSKSETETVPDPPAPRETMEAVGGWKLHLISTVLLLPTWMWFMKVWFWHGSEEAETLPGASGSGWFFRYLTFFGFTLQTLQLNLSVAAAFTANAKNLASGHGKWLRDLADTFSCVVFPFANMVTVLYTAVHYLTGRDGAVEGGEIERPPWLGFTVHYLNCIVAWTHMVLAPHSFSSNAERTSIAFVVAYLMVILVTSHYNGKFPYPFLNKLPFPWGFMGVAAVSILLFVVTFRLGKFVKYLVNGCLSVTSSADSSDEATVTAESSESKED